MKTNEKKIPQWVKQKALINHDEELIFIGEMGVAGIINGKLPNGDDYLWKKERKKRRKRIAS